MNLISPEFALFTGFFIVIYWLIPFKKVSLLIFSAYIIYLLSDLKTLLFLCVIIFYVHLIARTILGKSNRVASALFALGVFCVTLALLVVAYLGTIKSLFSNFLEFSALKFIPLEIIMPLGFGFYIFNAISYLRYHYNNRANKSFNPPSLLSLAIYLSFFISFLSGPFIKAKSFFAQLSSRKIWRQNNINEALLLIILGIFKKVVIASLAGEHTKLVFDNFANVSSGELFINLALYFVQIYADFSGYMDIMIGIGLLLGFSIPKNFNSPYMARNVKEFWSRWHITVIAFFRDNLYIPLALKYLSQKDLAKKAHLRDIKKYFAINVSLIFIAFLTYGIWHSVLSANSQTSPSYMLWMFSHFVAVLVFMIFNNAMHGKSIKIPLISKLVTFSFITLTWAFFALPSTSAFEYLKALFTNGFIRSDLKILSLALLIFIASQFLGALLESIRKFFYPSSVLVKLAVTIISLYISIQLGPEKVTDFIYVRFHAF